MKFKAVETLCKKNKYVHLYDRVNEEGECVAQWLGEGFACYPLEGFPYLNEGQLLTFFGVAENAREKWGVRCGPLPSGLLFEDTVPGEQPVEKMKISLAHNGMHLLPLKTSAGIVFIQSKYLAPLADVMDVIELYERSTEGGRPYIVAKAGMIIQAVIMPFDTIRDEFVELVEELADDCRRALRVKQDLDSRTKAGEAVQVVFNGHVIDTETGELMED